MKPDITAIMKHVEELEGRAESDEYESRIGNKLVTIKNYMAMNDAVCNMDFSGTIGEKMVDIINIAASADKEALICVSIRQLVEYIGELEQRLDQIKLFIPEPRIRGEKGEFYTTAELYNLIYAARKATGGINE